MNEQIEEEFWIIDHSRHCSVQVLHDVHHKSIDLDVDFICSTTNPRTDIDVSS